MDAIDKTTEEVEESEVYDDVYSYLTTSRYPVEATKADKATIWKRVKKFQVVDVILHYKQVCKDSTVTLRQVSLN